MPTYELYYYPSCPFCQRVLRYMDSAGIADKVTLKNIHANCDAADTLVRVGGKRQVPCLFVDGEPLYESLDIIDRLERDFA